MLSIRDLHAQIGARKILKGVNLEVKPGEVHAIMGPNGSGKSTLASVLAGRAGYEVTKGTAHYLGEDLLALEPEERARRGVFLAFQYPVEIPGVNNAYLLKAALNAVRKQRGLPELDAFEFLALIKDKMKLMQMDESFLSRGVNEGFSGGEKKRNEILQMAVLEPKLALLDETDSGLDIDALRVVATGVNSLRSPERAIVMVTHYQRLLDYIEPDFVHVLSDGRILRTGDKSLALELEAARLRLGEAGGERRMSAMAPSPATAHYREAFERLQPVLGGRACASRGGDGAFRGTRVPRRAGRSLEVHEPPPPGIATIRTGRTGDDTGRRAGGVRRAAARARQRFAGGRRPGVARRLYARHADDRVRGTTAAPACRAAAPNASRRSMLR